MDTLEQFKLDIEEYVKLIYSLILEDYGKYLPDDKLRIINNFNYKTDIVIDTGGRYSTGPGRWERKTHKLALSPITFYEKTFKAEMAKQVKHKELSLIEEKLKNSANETFTGTELSNLIYQKKLNHFDITKGIVIHEIFHSIITMKIDDEVYRIEYDDKTYDCKGVKGEYLEEGFVEYLARKFANKHNLFMFPSLPYQPNVEYAKTIEKLLGKNVYKLIFDADYRKVLNYIHKSDLIDEYNKMENRWLKSRIINRLEYRKTKDEYIDFDEVE